MQTVEKKIKNASIKISILQIMALSLFGFGYTLIKTEGSEKVLGVLIIFVGFHSIVNACDLGLTTSVARGDNFTWCDINTIVIFGLTINIIIGIIFAYICKHSYQVYVNPFTASILFFTIFANGIFKGFLDRKKAFSISTLINTFLIASSSNLYFFGINYLDANDLVFGLTTISFGLLIVSLVVLKIYYRSDLIERGIFVNTIKKLKKTVSISVINIQGNLYGRVDRFIYPYIWNNPVPNEFMILSEAAQRILIFTASISRVAVPYLGSGKIKFQKLNLNIEIKILAAASLITMVSLIMVSVLMTNIGSIGDLKIVLILSISIGFIVLSQYYFTGFLVVSDYKAIIISQIISLFVYLTLIFFFASSAEMLSFGFMLKTMSEFIFLRSRCNLKNK
jgi:hypothetical protein